MDKFCVNCKHSTRCENGPYICTAVYTVDLVTGAKFYEKCEEARREKPLSVTSRYSNYCGPHGNCFEKAA